MTDLPPDASVEEMMGALTLWWDQTILKLRERLRKLDSNMQRAYMARRDLGRVDLRTILTPGVRVIMRQKQPGKNKLRATGPYTFLNFVGQ